jgi:hypothetical protein
MRERIIPRPTHTPVSSLQRHRASGGTRPRPTQAEIINHLAFLQSPRRLAPGRVPGFSSLIPPATDARGSHVAARFVRRRTKNGFQIRRRRARGRPTAARFRGRGARHRVGRLLDGWSLRADRGFAYPAPVNRAPTTAIPFLAIATAACNPAQAGSGMGALEPPLVACVGC